MESSSKVLTFDNVGFKDGFEPSLNVLYNCHCLLFLQWCELHASLECLFFKSLKNIFKYYRKVVVHFEIYNMALLVRVV